MRGFPPFLSSLPLGFKELRILARVSRLCPVSFGYLESKLIPEVSLGVLWRLIGQTSIVSTLFVLLTRSRGEYLRVVGIIVLV